MLVALMLVTGVIAFFVIKTNREVFIHSLDARVELRRLVASTTAQADGARGFALTADAIFSDQYERARSIYPTDLARLRADLASRRLIDISSAVDRYDQEHALWERDVAEPLLRHLPATETRILLARGTALADQMAARAEGIDAQLRKRSEWISGVANVAIGGWIIVIVLLTAGFGALAVSGERRRLTQEARLRADIAARNDALERSNQSLQEFAYVASHDLQEPLRTVASFTQLLQKRYADKLDAQANEFIGFAVDGAMRMQQLINDILQYSRVTTHGKSFERVALDDAVERAVTGLRLRIAERGAEIAVTSWMPVVSGDSAQISQIFLNLIGNGIKYNRSEHPRIEISAQRDAGEWIICVADNGIGIAPEYQEQVFGIFTRLHTRDEFEGTGIGLALCRRILERHHGRIWLQSSEGSGSSFYFTLPTEIS